MNILGELGPKGVPISAEVIRFVCPNFGSTNLYVSGITNVKLNEDEVYFKLEAAYSSFGLVYEIQVFKSKHDAAFTDIQTTGTVTHERCSYYAFVKYYSSSDAQRAQTGTNRKYMIQGHLLKVTFSTRKGQNDYPLSYSKCCSLANHYLGFNVWSSSIVKMQEDKDHRDPTLVRFLCAAKLELPTYDIISEGIGVSEKRFSKTDFLSRLEAYRSVKRISFYRSMEDAFQQLAMIVLSNGKVAVELCSHKPDDLMFMGDEIKKQVIQVNNLDGQDDTSGTEEPEMPEDSALLDAMNNELLVDLMADV